MSDFWDDLIISNRRWAEPYYRSLSKLNGDITLKSQIGGKIYAAMDFFDIYEHCFPDLNIFLDEKLASEKAAFLRRESSRFALFFLLNNIYEVPILILPPHFSELVSFFNIRSVKIRKALQEEAITADNFADIKRYIEKVLSSYDRITELSAQDLLKKLQKDAPDLAFLFSPCFVSGLSGLRGLLVNKYIFSWDDIPGEDDEKLRSFLTKKVSAEWIKAAKFEKNDNEAIIRAHDEINSLSLKLNDIKTEVILEKDGRIIDKLAARLERNKLNIFTISRLSPTIAGSNNNDYYELILNVACTQNKDLEDFVKKWRPYGKIGNNKRDAKAIQYLEEINNKYLGEKDILLFISSDPIFNKYKIERDNRFRKIINGIPFPLMRTTYPFYIALIELCSLIGIHKDKSGLIGDHDSSSLNLMHNNIKNDLAFLSDYLNFTGVSASVCVSGTYSYYLEVLVRTMNNLRLVIDKRDRTALLLLIEKIYMERGLFNWSEDIRKEIIEHFENLKIEVRKEDFSQILFKRIWEFEKERNAFNKFINAAEFDGLGGDVSMDSDSSLKTMLFDIKGEFNLNIDNISKMFLEKMIFFPQNAGIFTIKESQMWVLCDMKWKNDKLYVIERENDKIYNIYVICPKHIYLMLSILLKKLDENEISVDLAKQDLSLIITQKSLMPLIDCSEVDFDYRLDIQILYEELTTFLGWSFIQRYPA